MAVRDDRDFPVRLRDLLAPVAEGLGMDSPIESGRLWAAWRELVGDHIADHAEPTSLRKGVLRIRADSPVWATEIGYLGEHIRLRVNDHMGTDAVVEIRVWTGPGRVSRRVGARDEKGSAGAARSKPRAVPEGPEEALRRARDAWAKRAGRGTSRDHR